MNAHERYHRVACPKCKAEVGIACVDKKYGFVHPERMAAADKILGLGDIRLPRNMNRRLTQRANMCSACKKGEHSKCSHRAFLGHGLIVDCTCLVCKKGKDGTQTDISL